jgi:NAD(P)-dependent dehydrogenase (short-subunit alcohol dehydrogenase family)
MAPGEKPPMPASNIANVILFLASDAVAMINGASIPVDQGVWPSSPFSYSIILDEQLLTLCDF